MDFGASCDKRDGVKRGGVCKLHFLDSPMNSPIVRLPGSFIPFRIKFSGRLDPDWDGKEKEELSYAII